MTSSKKAVKKPSSSFKKAWGHVAGQGDTGFNNDSTLSDKEKAAKATQNYRNLKADQEKGERQEQKKGSEFEYVAGERTDPEDPKKMVRTPKTTTGKGASPAERGVAGAEEGKTAAETAQGEQATTGAEEAAGRAEGAFDAKGAFEDKKADEAEKKKADRDARRQKAIEDAVDKKRKDATLKKEKFGPEEEKAEREKAAKEFDAAEDKEANDAANEELDKMNERRRNKIRDEMFVENVKNGMSREEALEKANKDADKFIEKEAKEKKRQEELAKRNTPEAIAKREKTYGALLNGVKDVVNGLGKIGEGINRGLDFMGKALHGMLNPSPLGFNEAQTMFSLTADAMGMADELVKTITNKGNDMIGKKIVNNMMISMGDIIDKNFAGMPLEDMTEEELDQFADQLSAAWEPFIKRLEFIGADNPAGARIAKQFQDTFEMIVDTGKDRKKEINTIAKDKRAKIAEERRLMVDRREEATKDAISSVRGEYMNFAGPVLPNGNPNPNYDASRYDPRKQKLWDLANKLYGKEALHTPAPKIDPNDPDPPSPEDRTFAWYFDPTKVDEDGNIKPAFAKKIEEEIATIKRNDPAEYKKFEKEYESIANEMAQIRASVKNDTQRREGLAKYRDQMGNVETPLEITMAQALATKKDFDVYERDNGGMVGGKIPIKKLAELERTARKTMMDLEYKYDIPDIESKIKAGTATPDETDIYQLYNLSKNTVNATTAINVTTRMIKEIDKITSAQGGVVRNPDGSPKLDAAGKEIHWSDILDMTKIDDLKQQLFKELNASIEDGQFTFDDIDNEGGVFRALELLKDDSDPLYQVARDIQDEMKDLNPNFPTFVGDPARNFDRRPTTLDIVEALNKNTDDLYDIISNIGLGLGATDDEGNVSDDFSANMDDLLSGMDTITDWLDDHDDLNVNIDFDRLGDAVDKSLNNFMSKLGPKMSKEGKAIIDGIVKPIVTQLKKSKGGKIDVEGLKKELRKANKKLDQLKKDAGRVADATERTAASAEEIAARPPATPAAPAPPVHHNVPKFFDKTNPPVSAGDAWLHTAGYGTPENWPTGKAYWRKYDELLGLIENVKDTDGSKAGLQEMAKKALIRGMFGTIDVTKDAKGNTVYSPKSVSQADGKDLGSLVKVDDKNVIKDAKGRKCPTRDGKLIMIPKKDGSGMEPMTLKEYHALLKGAALIESGAVKDLDIGGNERLGLEKNNPEQLERQIMRRLIQVANSK